MLEIRHISVDAQDEGGRREILKDISLRVGDGKLVALTGPNGGGKSTLAKTIAGIIAPATGSILVDGKDISGATITERARLGIGFAFQQPVRFKGLTVRDILTMAAGGILTEDRLYGYLRDVGLCASDYADREIGVSLSGGEIKRIEIASVIARGSRLTIFDEPEAGIDLWSFGNLIEVFKTLKHVVSGSVMIISHQERILEIADEIAVLADGEIVSHGPGKDILPGLLEKGVGCRFCPHPEDGAIRRQCSL